MKFVHLFLLCIQTLITPQITAQETAPPLIPFTAQYHTKNKEPGPLYICEVSSGSPPNSHALLAAERLITRSGPQWCVVKNSRGSKCTEMIYMGHAALAICGDKHAGIRCDEVGKVVKELSKRCAKTIDDMMRLGGKIMFGWGEVIVIRKHMITLPIPFGLPFGVGSDEEDQELYDLD